MACALIIAALFVSPHAASAAATCGDSVQVERGDTISSIAMRCDVDESQVLDANPGIKSSGDLRVGQSIRLKGSGNDAANRAIDALGSAAQEGIGALTGLARDLKSSTTELLDRNPDLRSRIDALRNKLTGGKSRQSVSGEVHVSQRASGSNLDLSATGLPPGVAVFIGLGEPRAAFDVVGHATTSQTGEVNFDAIPPEWARGASRLVATVGAESGGWILHSDPFSMHP